MYLYPCIFRHGDDLKIKIIAAGANSKEEDILPATTAVKLDDGGGVIVEDRGRCPFNCPPPSALNG